MGDSTLVVDTDTDQTLLIDAGNIGYGKKVIVPALQTLGITRIHHFVASHYDADHIGGIDEVVTEGIAVDSFIDRGDFTDRKTRTPTGRLSQYGEYLEVAKASNHLSPAPSCSPLIRLGPATTVELVASGGRYLRPDCQVSSVNIAKSKDNDLSIALVIKHGQFSYFIGGDLTGGSNGTTPMEDKIASYVGDVDVLRVNHHGSETSSSNQFLQKLSPEIAIISVGDKGVNLTYKLPRQTVLDRLASLTTPPLVFLTNKGEGGSYEGGYIENRHIILETNGVSYSINGVLRPTDERLPDND